MSILVAFFITLTGVFWFKAARQIFFPEPTTTTSYESNRIQFFDFARGIAIIGVIFIHVIKILADMHPDWIHWGYALSSASRFAIGFFLISSGALIDPASSWSRSFWEPKIIRILIPYALCVLVLVLSIPLPLSSYPFQFISGKASTPYYFISVLFQLYAIYFIISPFIDSKWFLPCALAISAGLFFVVRTPELFQIPIGVRYLFFFAYGIAHRDRLRALKPLPFIWPLALICSAYLILVTIYLEPYGNEQFIYSVALLEVLLFVYSKEWIAPMLTSGLSTIGKLSLWIFLIHYPIIGFSLRTAIEHDLPPIMSCIIASVILSTLLAYLLNSTYQKILSIIRVQ